MNDHITSALLAEVTTTLTKCVEFYTTQALLIDVSKRDVIEIGCVVTSLVVSWLVVILGL